MARIEDGPTRPVERSAALGGAAGGFLRVIALHSEHVIVARLAQPSEEDRAGACGDD